MDFGQLLLGSLSADQNTRVQATQLLEQASRDNLAAYLGNLITILATENGPFDINIRVAAGLAAKNCLVARDLHRRQQLIETFQRIEPSTKNELKRGALNALKCSEQRAASTGAQLVAALAYVQLPLNEWPDLLPLLHQSILERNSSRRAALEALGYICEEVPPTCLEGASGEILSAVVRGLGAGEDSLPVRLAASAALLNALPFLKPRLEAREEERNAVLRAVFEAVSAYTPATPAALNLAVSALECLVGLGEALYAHLRPYMHQGLAELTVNAMSSPEPQISLQGIEFWCTICEVEMELLEDNDLDSLNNFAKDSASTVIPLLLTRMAAQGHDDEDEDAGDEWTPAMAAATCLSLYATCIRDDILQVPSLLRFIEENLASVDWHFREAAVMAFGSILEGPGEELLQPLTLATFPALFRLMHDDSVSVRDTNMWTLGRICELHPGFIPLEHAEQLAASMAGGLTQPPRVACSSAWAVMHLMLRVSREEEHHQQHQQQQQGNQCTTLFSRVLPQLSSMLLEAAQRSDADEAGLRPAAYEALAEIISAAPAQSIDPSWLGQLSDFIITGPLEGSIRGAVEALAVEDQVRCSEIQSSCLALIGVLVRQARAINAPNGMNWNRLGAAMLGVAQAGAAGKTAVTSLEDLFVCLGALVGELGDWNEAGGKAAAGAFAAPFLPFVMGALARPDEAQLCRVVVGLVSDIARAAHGTPTVVNNLDALVIGLERILQSPACNRELKPPAITALGDLAASVGGLVWCAPSPKSSSSTSSHLSTSMTIFAAAGAIEIVDEEDLDEVDFVCELRLALVEAITWMIQGAKDESANTPIEAVLTALNPFLSGQLIPWLHNRITPWCLRELGQGSSVDPRLLDQIIRATSGLIGDLATVMPECKKALKPLAREFLRIESSLIGDQTRQTQRWALSVLQ